MARKTLSERMASLEAKKAAIQQQEAKLREAARKQRTRDLIALGGLVAKAGLADWPSNVLLGALLDIPQHDNPPTRQRWEQRGLRAIASERDQQGAAERLQPGGTAGAS